MKKLNARHYLEIYTLRKKMQEEGVTNPKEEVKTFTNAFVEKLQILPLDEEIILEDNSFYDRAGNLIMKVPD